MLTNLIITQNKLHLLNNFFFYYVFSNNLFFKIISLFVNVKKNLFLTLNKFISKKIRIKKKTFTSSFNKNNYYFKKNIYKFKNNVIRYSEKISASKKNFHFYPLFFQYYLNFSLFQTNANLVGSFKDDYIDFNENNKLSFYKNKNAISGLSKKHNISNLRFKSNFLKKKFNNFFFLLIRNKQFNYNVLNNLYSVFFLTGNVSNNFSKKNYSKPFLFTNSFSVKNIKNKNFNIYSSLVNLESFFFFFRFIFNKKIKFYKNLNNRFFYKFSDSSNFYFFKKKINRFKQINLTSFNYYSVFSSFSPDNFKNSYLNSILLKKKFIIKKKSVSLMIFQKQKNKSNVTQRYLKKTKNFFLSPFFFNTKTKKYYGRKLKSFVKIINFFSYNRIYNQNFSNGALINYLNLTDFKRFWFNKKKLKSNKYLFLKYKKLFFFLYNLQKLKWLKTVHHFYKKNFLLFLKKKKLSINEKKFKKLTFIFCKTMFFKKINKFFVNTFFNFFSNNLSNLSIENSTFFVDTIQLCSKHNYLFKHSLDGFFFLSTKQHDENLTNYSFIFKKIIYSFLGKNELQRYILKKYLKNFSIFPLIGDDDLSSNFNDIFAKQTNTSSASNSSFILEIVNHKTWPSVDKNLLLSKTYEDVSFNFSIKKIKFKPGYSIIWREARNVLKQTLGLNFKYQQKLTNYLLKYKKFVKHQHIKYEDFKLFNVLLYSKIVTDIDLSNSFIKNGLIFVNGYLITNPVFQIFKNDFIQFIVSTKYYILYRWLVNYSISKKIRLRHKSKNKLHSFQLEDDKQKSFNLPEWIISNKNLVLDVPSYMEVDYFTLSIFCLSNNITLNAFNSHSFVDVRYGVLNLYNWKYIN